MKRLLSSIALCATIIALTIACKTTDPVELTPLDTPTGLAESNITQTTATLTWNSVIDAQGYYVRIDNGEPAFTPTNSCQLTGLTFDTQYRWAVTAVANNRLMSPWSPDRTFRTEGLTIISLGIPTNLNATNITHNSATLTWDAVDSAIGYEIRIDDNEPITLVSTTHNATLLTPNTEHSWAVRSTDGNTTSPWSEPNVFSTAPVIRFISAGQGEFEGEKYGAGTDNFMIQLLTFDIFGGGGGGGNSEYMYMFVADLIAEHAETTSNQKSLDIPTGEYIFNDTQQVNTIVLGSDFTMLMDYSTFATIPILGGTMTVEGDNQNYLLTFALTLEEGKTTFFEYEGSISIPNPGYVTPEWKYETILGAYNANGTPSVLETIGENPGPPTWIGEITQPENGATDHYLVTNLFNVGSDYVCRFDVVDGLLRLDDKRPLAENVEIVGGRTVDVYVIGMFPYGNEWMIRASTPPELVWDAATKTITFPKTRFFGSYGFQTMRWGIGGYDTETGALATMFSEFYTEVVLGI